MGSLRIALLGEVVLHNAEDLLRVGMIAEVLLVVGEDDLAALAVEHEGPA